MTQIAFEQLFDRRGGLGTVDHCEFCGAHVEGQEPCDCTETIEEEEEGV